MTRAALAAALGAALGLAWTGPANAFCRTMTCDPNDPVNPCQRQGECLVGGQYLEWSTGCVSFGVHEAGSERRGIDYETARGLINQAFERWENASCPSGGVPSIAIRQHSTPIDCGEPEYNEDAGNANVWMFRDGEWPYEDQNSTLALTTVTFSVRTGEIFDADVEVNSASNALSIQRGMPGADLAAIVTHEAGHFLGLSHSDDPRATMFATYDNGAADDGMDMASLDADDIAGICTIYPPQADRSECSYRPRHGFASECASSQGGCAVSAPGRSLGGAAALALALGTAAAALRRRRHPHG